MNTITINGIVYVVTSNADIEYRSHINGMQCTCPDRWVSMSLEDRDGNVYKAWYMINDPSVELDSIDYDRPDDITDEFGKIVYDKDQEEY